MEDKETGIEIRGRDGEEIQLRSFRKIVKWSWITKLARGIIFMIYISKRQKEDFNL